MDKSTCPRCGGQIIASGNGRFRCPYCRFVLPEEITNEELTLLYGANQQLRIGNFDEAEALFRDVVSRYPKSSEAHWGLVLSRYGIKYEDDYDGSKVPSCYAAQYESVFEDPDYKKALELADEETAGEYKSTAETIEKVRIEWLEKASKETPYDIFLSYKDTEAGDGTAKTDDYNRVYELYNHLTGLGYRVFFARVSLRDKAGERNYEPYIFNALNTAHAMIVYASKPEYVTATWVKNEWMRFYRRMKDGKKQPNSLVVAYSGFNPALLPKPLDHIQNFDANTLTFVTEIDAYLERVVAQGKANSGAFERISVRAKPGAAKRVEKTKLRKAGATAVAKPTPSRAAEVKTRSFGGSETTLNAGEEELLNIATSFLEHGQFENALDFAGQILDKNPNNGRALYLSLLAKTKCTDVGKLRSHLPALSDYGPLISVIDHAGKDIAAELLSHCCTFVAESLNKGTDIHAAFSLYHQIASYSHGGVKALHILILSAAPKLYASNPVPSSETDRACAVAFSFLLDDAGICQEALRELIGSKGNAAFSAMVDARLNEYEAQFGQDAFSVSSRLIRAHGKKTLEETLAVLSPEEIGECDGLLQTLSKEEAVTLLTQAASTCIALLSGLGGTDGAAAEETHRRANAWAGLILSYDYPGRSVFLADLTNAVKAHCTPGARPLFKTVVNAAVNDAAQRASEIGRFARRLCAEGYFADAVEEFAEAISYAPGDSELHFGRILAACRCRDVDDPDARLQVGMLDVKEFGEPYFATAKSDAALVEMLERFMRECLEGAGDPAALTVGEALLRYYPESETVLVSAHANELAAHALKRAKKQTRPLPKADAFLLAERLYRIAVGINPKDHRAHWGLLQCALKCADDGELIDCAAPIGKRKEYRDAIVAAGSDKSAIDGYIQVEAQQQKQLQRKSTARKRRRIKFAIGSIATALVSAAVVVAIALNVWVIPNAKRGEAISLVNSGDYQAAIDTLSALDASRPEVAIVLAAAKAGVALNEKEVEKAIDLIEGAGGTVDIAYDPDGGMVQEPTAAAKKNKNAKQLPTAGKRGYSFTEWKIQEYTLECNGETIRAGVKLKALYTLVSYAITYDLAGGKNNPSNPSAYDITSETIVFRDPVRSGYDFAGWEDAAGMAVTSIASGSVGERSLTATWTPLLNSLSVESEDESKGTVSLLVGQGYTDEAIKVSATPKEGFDFACWVKNGEKVSSVSEYSFVMPDKDVSLVATWRYALNELNVVSEDTKKGGVSIAEGEGRTNDAMNVVATPNPGYSFAGWYESGNKVADTAEYSFTMPAHAVSLTAKWSLVEYSVSYDLAGGTGAAGNPKAYTVESATINLESPAREAYAFSGWRRDDGTMATMIPTGSTGNLAFTATWTAIEYGISYDLDGGTNDSSNPSKYTVESETIDLKDPTKAGYGFTGWKDADGNPVTSISNGSSGDVSLLATWTASLNPLTVTTESEAKGTASILEGKGYTDENVKVLATPKEGYSFKGWYEGDDKVSAAAEYAFKMPARAVSLVAKFILKSEEEQRAIALGMRPAFSSDGKKVTYGLYPQQNANDYLLVAKLNALEKPESNGYYLYQNAYYAKVEANPHGSNYIFDSGMKITAGTTYWFKCEPITWDVLSIEDGTYYLLSDTLIDARRYAASSNNYKDSEIRSWLNGDFYSSAFALDDSLILTTDVDNGADTTGFPTNPYICADTSDKVFLPSYADYTNPAYGFSEASGTDAARCAKPTDWARACGAQYNTSTTGNKLNGVYSTRSPYNDGFDVAWHVFDDGAMLRNYVFYGQCAVRPAIKVSLDPHSIEVRSESDAKGTAALVSGEGYAGESTTVLATPEEGYSFEGWYRDGIKVSGDAEYTFTMPADELTLVAKWKPTDYFITYKLAGGTNNPQNPDKYTVESPEIALRDATREGYAFAGWQDDMHNTVTTIPSGSKGHLYFTATWDPLLNLLSAESENASKGTASILEGEGYTDETIKVAATPKEGYAFAGWYEGETKVGDDAEYTFTMPARTVSLVAKWTPALNSLSVVSEDESKGGVSVVTGEGYTEETIKVLATPKAGYSFAGWYDGANKISADAEYAFTMPAKGVSLTAKWAPVLNALAVDTENSSMGAASVIAGQGYTGETIKLSAIPSDGYAFLGWYDGATLVSDDPDYSFTMPAKGVALTARFLTEEEKQRRDLAYGITPSFSSDGTTVTYGLYPQTNVSDPALISALNALKTYERNGYYLYEGSYYAKTIAEPCNTGYVFDNGTTIVSGNTYWFKCEPITWKVLSGDEGTYYLLSDVLLDAHRFGAFYQEQKDGVYANDYAHSEIRSWLNAEFYCAAFALGDSYVQVTEVDNGAATTSSATNPYACENTQDKVFLPSYKDYVNPEYGFDSAAARYAKTTDWARARGEYYLTPSGATQYNGDYWTRSPWGSPTYVWSVTGYGDPLYTYLHYDYYGVRPAITIKLGMNTLAVATESAAKGSVSASKEQAYPGETMHAYAVPADHYSFVGWYEGETKVSGDAEYVFAMPARSVSLVAKWAPIEYSVTYELAGGTNNPQNPDKYTVESPAIELKAATREGYVFDAWKDAKENTVTSIPSGSFGNLVLTATWSPLKYVLNVATEGASRGTVSVLEGQGFTGETIKIVATPNNGYVFIGWYSGDNKVSDASQYAFTMPAANVSLTARFREMTESEKTAFGMVPAFSTDVKTVTYGLYPQKNVNDANLVAALNAIELPESNGYYLYQGVYYAKATAKPYGSGYVFDNGTQIVSDATYWFKCEPITWRVLSVDGGSYYLLSDVLLDAHCYNDEFYSGKQDDHYANDYAQSEIRSWLNGAFYSSTFSLDGSAVLTTEVDNGAGTTESDTNPHACENTQDKVFLLSYRDYLNPDYGFADSIDSSSTRYAKTTDWARANGSYYDNPSGAFTYNGTYWTRSPDAGQSGYSWYVYGGALNERSGVDHANYSVRPAITIHADAKTLSVQSEDTAKGTVETMQGSGYPGEAIRVVATPKEGYFFEGWYEGEKKVSSDAEYAFTMPGNGISITARFISEEEELQRAKAYGTRPLLSADGKTVTYGLYPQKNVSDSALVSALNALGSPQSNGYYLYEDVYYAKLSGKPFESSYVFDGGAKIASGTTYWFKCEPITWNVLANDGDSYLVVSNVILDAHRYDESTRIYKDSEIRSWLNSDFLGTAFALNDSAIEVTSVDNSAATTASASNSYACENTQDKVFLLSYQDCLNASYGFGSAASRAAKTTDWARANGVWCNTSSGSYQYNGFYWNRSPDSGSANYVWTVDKDGAFFATYRYPYHAHGGVRPCITVTIEFTELQRAKAYGTKPILSSDGKTVTYGLYPQKRVSDSSVVSALNSIPAPESNGYYLYRDAYYAKTVAKPYGSSYVFDDGTTIVSGTTYWFKCEPITWKVLSETSGTYYVLSETLLDAHRYAAGSNNYANSEIRSWLNGDFYGSAFALADSAILTTIVDNSAATTNSSSNQYACANTRDKVFLPSYRDYVNSSYGFSGPAESSSDTRCAKTTDWARARGARYYTSSGSHQYNGYYWTRSPRSAYPNYAWLVDRDGRLDNGVPNADYGVRPSLSIVIA